MKGEKENRLKIVIQPNQRAASSYPYDAYDVEERTLYRYKESIIFIKDCG